jgi:mRNA interferase MazF
MSFKRGEVHVVNLDPTVGREIQKRRPCVVVSTDIVNVSSDLLIIVPITDAIGKTGHIHISIPQNEGGLKKPSVANCLQIRAVSTDRILEKWGHLSAGTMQRIDAGLRLTLGLD